MKKLLQLSKVNGPLFLKNIDVMQNTALREIEYTHKRMSILEIYTDVVAKIRISIEAMALE